MSASHDTLFEADGALIVGAGLAGLFTALKMAPHPVTVLSPMALGEGASSARRRQPRRPCPRYDRGGRRHR
jgi:L-aspartate oxidase